MTTKLSGNYGDDFGVEFQKHILSVAARAPNFILRFRTALDDSYFTSEISRVIMRALLTHVDKYHKLPTKVTLIETVRPLVDVDTMEKFEKEIGKLYRRDISDSEAVADKVVDFGKTQALVNAVVEAAEEIEKGNKSIVSLIQEAQLVGEDILNVGIDYVEDIDARIERYHNPYDNYNVIPTGQHHVDLALQGGIARGELGVVVAPAGRGKTTELINIGFGAIASLQGLDVVHYSLEMGDKRITTRYDDRLMGGKARYKHVDRYKYTKILRDRVSKFVRGRLLIKSYPTRSASIDTIRAHLSLLNAQGVYPALVIVDYGDIMKASRRLGEMRHEQAGIYEDLRRLAGEFNCGVWTGSQAKQSALEKETITIADFAEAFEKAAIVDVAIGLCQTVEEKIDNRCRLFFAKMRNAEDNGYAECIYDKRRCLIKTTALYNAAFTRIDDSDEDDEVTTRTTYTPTERSEKLKREVGLKRGRVSVRKGKRTMRKAKRPSKRVE